MKKICLLLLALLCLTGCSATEQPADTVAAWAEETTQPQPTEPPYYQGAMEHYLGNGLDYSWEQLYPPEYVMLHFCSAVVNHPDDPYRMEYVRQTFIDADVSIHYIIDRDGTIYCYVPENRTAWHAGVGEWLDDDKYTNKMNMYSIGIELLGIGTAQEMSLYMTKAQYNKLDKSLLGFTDAQYTALKELVEDVCDRHNIPMDREHIIGHADYNPRKNDPGELFDWSRILP